METAPIATNKLNDKACKALKHGKKADGGGMFLYALPSGTRVWQLAFRYGGKQKIYSIGIYPEVSLAEAREKRDEVRKIVRAGRDPMAEKLAARANHHPVNAKTFGMAADEWLIKERSAGRATKTLEIRTKYVSDLKTKFGNLPTPEIRRSAVLDFLRTFEANGRLETRDRMRIMGEKICNFADDEENPVENPFRAFSKEKLLEKRSISRAALVDTADAAKLFRTIAGEDDIIGLAIRFMALTAMRPGEIRSAEWADIDLDAARWHVPASKMKMRKAHCVPLSRQAIAILREAKKMTDEGRFIFSTGRGLKMGHGAMNKRLRARGVDTAKEHTGHGFRSTFSTILNGEEGPNNAKRWDSTLIELQLAHITGGVEAIYNRSGPEALINSRAAMMQHWSDRVDAMVDGGKVIQMQASIEA